MLNNFDQRQLNQMKSLIAKLEKREIGISKFVSDQWSLVEMLQTIDSQWKKDFFSLVNQIEDLHAASLDQGKKQMNEPDTRAIDKILGKMHVLVDSV